MAISKVVYNDATLIDISEDTVTRDKLAYGVTAHDKSGNRIVGTADMDGAGMIPTKLSDLENDLDFVTEAEMENQGYIQNGTTDNVTLGGNVVIGGTDALFKVVEVSGTMTGGKDDRNQTLNTAVNPGTGWTPIGVVGAYSSLTTYFIYRAYLNGDNVVIGARYTADNTSAQVTLKAYVLCMRTSAS